MPRNSRLSHIFTPEGRHVASGISPEAWAAAYAEEEPSIVDTFIGEGEIILTFLLLGEELHDARYRYVWQVDFNRLAQPAKRPTRRQQEFLAITMGHAALALERNQAFSVENDFDAFDADLEAYGLLAQRQAQEQS